MTLMDRKRIRDDLREEAKALGFSMMGVTPAQPARRLNAYFQWLENAYQGEMGYMARPDRIARRRDLEVILPGVETVICLGLDYQAFTLPDHIATDPARGRITNYAWGADYHDVMTPRLEKLADWLGERAEEMPAWKVYVDTGAILERDHAEQAGLGFTGKNTMLIGPQRGSWFFLGEILTTLALPPDEPAPMPGCGSCRRCLDACPTDAFPKPYVLDARRCISYLTIELKGWIPRELRPLMGNWLYGCDICQAVCPFNRFAPESAESAFRAAAWDDAAPSLLDILALDEAGFQERFANSPIKRIKRRGLLRNACVNAGNWGDEAAVPAVAALLSEDELLLRGHAAWALGRIGRKVERGGVKGELKRAARNETDERVAEEMRLALALLE
jgi:epoxyqueuosine reductase